MFDFYMASIKRVMHFHFVCVSFSTIRLINTFFTISFRVLNFQVVSLYQNRKVKYREKHRTTNHRLYPFISGIISQTSWNIQQNSDRCGENVDERRDWIRIQEEWEAETVNAMDPSLSRFIRYTLRNVNQILICYSFQYWICHSNCKTLFMN